MDFYSKHQASDEQILLPIFAYTYRCVGTILIKLYGYSKFNSSLKVSHALQTKLTEISVIRYFHVTIIFIEKIRKRVRREKNEVH